MRRHLLIAAIFLLAGAVVNVAVAWGCAAYIDIAKSSRIEVGRREQWHVVQRRIGGASRVLVLHRAADVNLLYDNPDGVWALDGMTKFSASAGIWRSVFPSRLHTLPSWVSINEFTRREPTIVTLELEDARGWPMLALRCRIVPQRPSWRSVDEVQGGLALSPRKQVYPWFGFRALPFHPIWHGFAINTLLYATILWFLIPGPFALRRFLRMRRGLCPACAYPMGESAVCSECGEPLRKHAVA